MTADPTGPLRDLHRRLAEEAVRRGLVLVALGYFTQLDGGPDSVFATFLGHEELLAVSPEQLATNAAFAQIEAAERDLATQARIDAARAEMARRLAEGGDLLGDD